MSDWKSELEEAKELFEAGIISESDFEELKSEVLKKRDSLISYGVIDETSAAGESDLVEMVLIPAGEFMMGVGADTEVVADHNFLGNYKMNVDMTERNWENRFAYYVTYGRS